MPPPAPLPSDWSSLVRAPAPFTALYKLACCGQRGLLLAVRGGGGRVALSVAGPLGGVAAGAWVTGGQGWVERVKERCRKPLPFGMIPLSGGAALPLDADMAASLLSGLLPEGLHELPEAPGWVEGTVGGLRWRARVEGPHPHCTRVVAFRSGEAAPVLVADMRDPMGVVPAAITFTAGAQKAELELQEWRPGEPPQAPAWLSLPACGGER